MKTYNPTNATINILDGQSNNIFTSESVEGANGTFVFTYKVPENLPGGEYYVTVNQAKPAANIGSEQFSSTRKFRIESYS